MTNHKTAVGKGEREGGVASPTPFFLAYSCMCIQEVSFVTAARTRHYRPARKTVRCAPPPPTRPITAIHSLYNCLPGKINDKLRGWVAK
jgi:hypothetical protein